MKYQGEFLWPPRPTHAVPEEVHLGFVAMGYYAQCKKNGSCSVIHIVDGKIETFWTRHGDERVPPPHVESAISAMTRKLNNTVLVAEVLGNKVKGGPKALYIFDCIVHAGQQLIGTTLKARLQNIADSVGAVRLDDEAKADMTQRISMASETLRYARTWKLKRTLEPMKNLVIHPEDEGVVFKSMRATLTDCRSSPTGNGGWQAKTRLPHKNYSF